jgi:mitochondrial fission protein ELM1
LKGHQKWPDFVVSSGVHSTAAGRAIKRLSGDRTFLIQNQSPKEHYGDFDLISIPDNLAKPEERLLPNVITPIGVPHVITPDKIAAGTREWETQFSQLPSPRIAVLLGGDTRDFEFTPEQAALMAKSLNHTAQKMGGSLIVTTSRRTGDNVAEAFMEQITVPGYMHDWKHEAARGNPYFGILGLADAVVVTGDSMTMCCEANASKKPVYIYAPEGGTRRGDSRLHTQLYERNVAKPFKSLAEDGLVPWTYTTLDTAGIIASRALARWQDRNKVLDFA